MFELLYQHPFLTGTVIAAIASAELCFLIFRFDRYQTFFRRRRWMNLLFQESQSRAVLISSAVLFLVIGLAIIIADKALLPRPLCSVACALAFINFLAVGIYDKRRKQRSDGEEVG
jgi:hypothetical protein